jgi:carboxypeptidase C (cathepsin A)
MPGAILSDVGGFNISTYFLYFEARNNPSTAPLAVYLAGGAGESSVYTALASETGPCYVNTAGNATELNPWSFNNNVNMLYIDQPVQTGFSYDSLVNGTFNLTSEIITPLEFNSSTAVAATDPLTTWGTFPSQDPLRTTNTTVASARAVWHFGEHWLSSFPPFSTSSSSNKISFWGNSYGGLWAPEVAARFSKNFKSLPATHPLKRKDMVVDTLGLTNGCIDFEQALPGFPEYAYNNTYGVQFLSEAQYNAAMDNLTSPGGALDLIKTCRTLGLAGDPQFFGNNETVNKVCGEAFVQGYAVIGASDALNNVCIF